jgi:hypothetical protein
VHTSGLYTLPAVAPCVFLPVSNFTSEVEAVEDPAVRAALRDLCLLYATTHIVDNLGGWVGHLTADQVSHRPPPLPPLPCAR